MPLLGENESTSNVLAISVTYSVSILQMIDNGSPEGLAKDQCSPSSMLSGPTESEYFATGVA